MYYHLIHEYQTKETMYNAVRRFGKVWFDTLRLSHKVVAQKENGSVKFGHENGSDYLFDTDIYIYIYMDGHTSERGSMA